MLNLVHILAQPVGWAARGAGAVQNVLPGQGDSSLNQVGRAITSGTAVLSNPGGLLSGSTNAFTDPTEAAANAARAAGSSGSGAPAGSNPSPTGAGQYSGVYSGGYGGGSVVDPAVAAFLGGQIGNVNSQIDALPDQLAVGRSNILSSANNATNRENESFAQAERDYNTGKQQTIDDMLRAKENIDTSVRQQNNALQRLLGLAGSGNSSAATTLAPYAAGRQGSIARGQVQTEYGRNLQATDTAFGDTKAKHGQNLGDINNQEFQNENQLESDIANTKASLLNTLAGLTMQQGQASGMSLSAAQAAAAPFMQQINAIIAGAAKLGSQYANPINLTAPSVYTPPDLSAYNYDNSAPPTFSTDVTYGDQVSPYLTGLFSQKDKSNLVNTGA